MTDAESDRQYRESVDMAALECREALIAAHRIPEDDVEGRIAAADVAIFMFLRDIGQSSLACLYGKLRADCDA